MQEMIRAGQDKLLEELENNTLRDLKGISIRKSKWITLIEYKGYVIDVRCRKGKFYFDSFLEGGSREVAQYHTTELDEFSCQLRQYLLKL
jgi:hypothetical protein